MAREAAERQEFPNRVRDEVEAMYWPAYLDDREGELLREAASLRRSRNFWRALALFLFACAYAFVGLMLLFT